MLKIDPVYLKQLKAAQSSEDLHFFVQKAIELEHSTIPPYLTAVFSIMPGSNEKVKSIINSIAVEEMLHFNIACNILNALGGKPSIYKKDFVPDYPSVLPLNISSSLKVGLEKLSKKLVKKIFMEIEKPEKPLNFPVIERLDLKKLKFATIGQFYRSIQQKIAALPNDKLPGDPALQVTGSFSPQHLFPIVEKKDAIGAIDIIIDQGEGTTTTPLGKEEEIAHYYRFNEIVTGRELVRDDSVKQGFSYSGEAVSLDEGKIYPISANTKTASLPAGSPERKVAEEFQVCYSEILRTLDETFNGKPERFNESFTLMFELSEIASRLVSTPYPGEPGVTIGPCFEINI